MSILDNYFLNFNNIILFLTLKKIKINNLEYLNIDLPVYSKNLLDNIKNNSFNNEIYNKYFFEGIILLNGINKNFENIELINKYIYFNNLDINKFIENMLKKDYDNFEELIYNVILLKGGEELVKLNLNLKKFYCKVLIDLLSVIENKYNDTLKNEIKIRLNKLLKINENDPYIHMMYGDIYKLESLYIKSKLSYELAIKNSQNNKMISFLRKNIDDISIKCEIEQILVDLKYFKFEKIYKSLNLIKSKKIDSEDNYWLGFIYYKLNEFNSAIYYYEKALNLDINYLNLFLELGISYYKINKLQETVRIYSLGLKTYPDDENLLFNKILVNLKLKNIDEAKNDIDRILMYEDLNIHIMNDVLYLKNLYKL